MSNLSYKPVYRRNLPHIQPQETTLFVTFRLIDSIPQAVVNQWREESIWLATKLKSTPNQAEQTRLQKEFQRHKFLELEKLFDQSSHGENWLKDPHLAQIVCESLKFRDGNTYRLDAFCVMSNHVHLLCMPLADDKTPGTSQGLQKILHSFKRFTALECNKLLNRTGPFWQSECFDHYIRSHDEWVRVARYILNNPVKAQIVKNWQDYPFSYCGPNVVQFV